MFVRIKTISGKRYAYLVENDWTRKGSRQKVKRYLGKVLRFEPDTQARAPDLSKKNDFKDIVRELIHGELARHGFTYTSGPGKDVLVNNDVQVHLDEKGIARITRKGKNVVLELNEGFLCPETANVLLNFSGYGREEEVGTRLANTVVEAGLDVPKETFITLFHKIFRRAD